MIEFIAGAVLGSVLTDDRPSYGGSFSSPSSGTTAPATRAASRAGSVQPRGAKRMIVLPDNLATGEQNCVDLDTVSYVERKLDEREKWRVIVSLALYSSVSYKDLDATQSLNIYKAILASIDLAIKSREV